MKKLFVILAILLITFLIVSYFFISNKVEISKVALLSTNNRTAYRCLTQKDLLQQFLSGRENTSDDGIYIFTHNDISFQFKQRLFDLVEVPVHYKDLQLNSFISFNQLSADSTGLQWKTEMVMSANPFKRIRQYLQAKRIHKSMSYILGRLAKFSSNNKNVYGFNIERTTVMDSLLLTTKVKSNTYPTELEYYSLINKIQEYIIYNEASPSNYPMLNIAAIDSNLFETTVAVPVNQVLRDNGSILFKRMFAGNILTAEVKGGALTVEEGFRQLNNYVSDHGLVPPAIPFQSMVTDRLAEKDTLKWITKLYYPIY